MAFFFLFNIKSWHLMLIHFYVLLSVYMTDKVANMLRRIVQKIVLRDREVIYFKLTNFLYCAYSVVINFPHFPHPNRPDIITEH